MLPIPSSFRSVAASASLALAIVVTGCSGQDGGNNANVEMSGLEKADGTINDAMTDLDGVRVEGTAIADAGNATGPNANAITSTALKSGSNETAPPAEEEVVAEQ